MKNRRYKLEELIQAIDPSILDYTEWVKIGMALHHEGYNFKLWDDWSRRDTKRYKGNGGMERKWQGFGTSPNPVTGGSIVALARAHGWKASPKCASFPGGKKSKITGNQAFYDNGGIASATLKEPSVWDPAKQVIEYLEALFESDEVVGYVTKSWYDTKDGRYKPGGKGSYTRTAGELIEQLSRSTKLSSALGSYDQKAGAWIRFNPLDGKGIKNDNVTKFKYALVESDSISLNRQEVLIKELELPVVILVHSGHKSLHAVVRIDAKNYQEYRERVDYLYSVCQKNGFDLDTQNKNPSRLSRLPGCLRGECKQFIVSKDIGKKSWLEWQNWMDERNNSFPCIIEDEDIDAEQNYLDPLIEDILYPGDKMMIAGRSKAGKSYALIELCCAIATGSPWFGKRCRQGKVLYINLELKERDRRKRFRLVRDAMQASPEEIRVHVHFLDLRGRSAPLEQLSGNIIRMAAKHHYDMVVIDPLYKVISGDENSAEHVAKFCNQIDRLSEALNCAVVYCHHHSKGQQGRKSSLDRASGSGVFARDADALLDMIEIELSESMRAQRGLNDKTAPASAWRIEATLREFAPLAPINIWFDWPLHLVDESGFLSGIKLDSERRWGDRGGGESKKAKAKTDQEEKVHLLREALKACLDDNVATTRENVQERIGEFDGQAPSKGQIISWTTKSKSPWTPIIIDETKPGNILCDTSESDTHR